MKTAFIFPGQGAQKVGMGKNFFDSFPESRSVFEAADEALGEKLSDLIFEGPMETLTLTANTQPAIVTVSIAALRAFQTKCRITPDFVAGHSLGEFSALVAAGAMSFADAVRVTRARGTFMQEAVPAGRGAMAAIMKMEDDDVRAICAEASQGDVVSAANFNSPGQVVISGDQAAVDRASALAKEKGGRVIPLKVSAPFHCALMAPAAVALENCISSVQFSAPTPAVVSNVEATPNLDPSRIRSLLVNQVTAPVLWTDSVRFMIAQGVTRFIEFGPGNVLAGLISKIDASVQIVSVNEPESIDNAIKLLE